MQMRHHFSSNKDTSIWSMPCTSFVQISRKNNLCVCTCHILVGYNLLEKQKCFCNQKSSLYSSISPFNMSKLKPGLHVYLPTRGFPTELLARQAAKAPSTRATPMPRVLDTFTGLHTQPSAFQKEASVSIFSTTFVSYTDKITSSHHRSSLSLRFLCFWSCVKESL